MNPAEIIKRVEPLEIEEEESKCLVKDDSSVEEEEEHEDDEHQQQIQNKLLCGLGIVVFIGFSIMLLLFFVRTEASTDIDAEDSPVAEGQKFFIHQVPAMTTDLVYPNPSSTAQISSQAQEYVAKAKLNEDLAELWLHKGFDRHNDRTQNPLEAQVFLVPAYFYMSAAMGQLDGVSAEQRLDQFILQLGESIEAVAKLAMQSQNAPANETVQTWIQTHNIPHVLLSPATNAPKARNVGIHKVAKFLKDKIGEQNVYIISFERNGGWAGGVALANVIVAPYVVKPHMSPQQLPTAFTNSTRNQNFVFYFANSRPHAVEWAGCNRSMVLPLRDEPNTKIGLNENLASPEFQRYMLQSDFCLVTCGDTPTSRRLTDSMIMGCIPIFIGTRLFGECEAPCFPGWGWTYTHGLSHLPYEEAIPWRKFPIVDEATFAQSPKKVLQTVFQNFTTAKKMELRSIMQQNQFSFVFGWDSPLSSSKFGGAVPALWKSITHRIFVQNNSTKWLI